MQEDNNMVSMSVKISEEDLAKALDQKLDEFNRSVWTPQIEGQKAALELPGIVDQVVAMAEIKNDDGESYRAFICNRPNPFGYPAGDRSGFVDAAR